MTIAIYQRVFEIISKLEHPIWKKICALKYIKTDDNSWEFTEILNKNESGFWISIVKKNKKTQQKVNIKVGRLINYLKEFGFIDFPGHEIEKATIELVSFFKNDKSIIELDYSEITEVYNGKNYLFPNIKENDHKKGTLSNSCMRYQKCQSYLTFYNNIPSLKILVMFQNKKVTARALLWSTQQGAKIIDRIYYTEQWQEMIFLEYARKNNYLFRKKCSDSDLQEICISNSNNDVIDEHFTVELNENPIYNYFPYIDTFYYLDIKTNRLSNKPFSTKNNINIKLLNTNGQGNIENLLEPHIFLSKKEFDKYKSPGLSDTFLNLNKNININEFGYDKIYYGIDNLEQLDKYDLMFINWENIKGSSKFLNLESKLKDGVLFLDYINNLKNKNDLNHIFKFINIKSNTDYINVLHLIIKYYTSDINNVEYEDSYLFKYFRYENNYQIKSILTKNNDILINTLLDKFQLNILHIFYNLELIPKDFYREILKESFDRSPFNIEYLLNRVEFDNFINLFRIVPEYSFDNRLKFIERIKKFGKSSKYKREHIKKMIEYIRLKTNSIPNGTPFYCRKGFREKINWFLGY